MNSDGSFDALLADRYQVNEELGRGAMGTVYRATDVRLGRPVAVKVLHSALTNALGARRFQSEIRIAAGLHHPNIAGVHEAGDFDGRLFYVMDYLGGETLRDRLRREKQLPLDDAIAIAEQVAAALQYAHDHHVVHRDVKPENILLSEGRAVVADFGLARAFGDVDTERLTASGFSVGTPHYVSPEQASAERDVGPQADQYALACVLYEMLVGEPPFTGPTAAAIAMRHVSQDPVSARIRRKTTPAPVDLAMLKALEKVPADRYPSVHEFALALRAEVPVGVSVVPAAPLPSRRVPRRALLPLAAAGVLGAASLAMSGGVRSAVTDALSFRSGADTNRIVVVRGTGAAATPLGAAYDARLRDAIESWDGVTVVAAPESSVVTGFDNRTAAAAAQRVRAGRFVLTSTRESGDSTIFTSEMFDVGRESPVGRAVQTVSKTSSPGPLSLERVSLLLLFGAGAAPLEEAARGTRNRAAFAAFAAGRRALSTWNLAGADSAFASAVRSDSRFGAASLWLATTRYWSHDLTPETGVLVSRALDDTTRLSHADHGRALALDALAQRRYPDACARYAGLVRGDSLDFGSWYGLADCTRRDGAVVADARSPSGVRFRTSRRASLAAIERAFDLLPQVDSCCVARMAAVIREQFALSSSTWTRFGRSVERDSSIYVAYPELLNDTLAFMPLPVARLNDGVPSTHADAVFEVRRAFLRTATKRAGVAPHSAYALGLMAEAMELTGDASAADTVRRARTLAQLPQQRLSLAAYEAWLRFKYSLPGGETGLLSARTLADSLVAGSGAMTSSDAEQVAGLAALLGRASTAARLVALGGVGSPEPDVSSDIQATGLALRTYAAMGGPTDSLVELQRRLTSAIRNQVRPARQEMISAMQLGRAERIAFPYLRPLAMVSRDTNAPLVAAERSFLLHDVPSVRRALARATASRRNLRPSEVTPDALHAEAWLYAAIGDSAAALAHIMPTLDAIRDIPASELRKPEIGGSVVQLMGLASQLLAARGDHAAARRWARVVLLVSDTTSADARNARAQVWSIGR